MPIIPITTVFAADHDALIARTRSSATESQRVEHDLLERLFNGTGSWQEPQTSRIGALRALRLAGHVSSTLLARPDKVPLGKELFNRWLTEDETDPVGVLECGAHEGVLGLDGTPMEDRRLIIASAWLDNEAERRRVRGAFAEWVLPESILLIAPATTGLGGADLERILRFAGVQVPILPAMDLEPVDADSDEPF